MGRSNEEHINSLIAARIVTGRGGSGCPLRPSAARWPHARPCAPSNLAELGAAIGQAVESAADLSMTVSSSSVALENICAADTAATATLFPEELALLTRAQMLAAAGVGLRSSRPNGRDLLESI